MITDYIGVPYKDKGRDLKGCDCFGLVKLYYKNELGIIIPDVAITADQPRRIFANFLNEISQHWKETLIPEKGCVIAMAVNENHPKLVTHFAVMLNERQVLHTLNKKGSHIVKIDDPTIKTFIKGFYKWQH